MKNYLRHMSLLYAVAFRALRTRRFFVFTLLSLSAPYFAVRLARESADSKEHSENVFTYNMY